MRSDRRHRFLMPFLALVLAVSGLAAADESKAPALPPALTKPAPESIEDLKAIQEHVKKVLAKVVPATVGVRIGQSSGSAVIVKKEDGYYALTAGHVSGAPGRDVTLLLHDGKTIKGKSQGNNRGIDSGLIKITHEGDLAHVEMGGSADLERGQWCVAVGHPGGFKPGRTPVVRLGRVLSASKTVIQSDCALVGGDSGGPLFDMNGKIIGIHSRIGGAISANMHVPVDTYRETWDRLAKGEVIGAVEQPYLGVQGETDPKGCRVTDVTAKTAAETAGLKVGDVISKFDGRKVEGLEDLQAQIRRKKPGDEVALEILRGDESLNLKVKLGKR